MEEFVLLFYQFLIFSWIEQIWELYLLSRQCVIYNSVTEIPPILSMTFDHVTFEKARMYSAHISCYSAVRECANIIALTFCVVMDGIYSVWKYAGEVLKFLHVGKNSEVAQSLFFVFIFNTCETILSLPFVVYFVFVLEEGYGFNKQTIKLFLIDTLKLYAIDTCFTLAIVTALIYIVNFSGRLMFLLLWAFSILVMIFMLLIYPALIAPFLDRYKPLPDGELKTKIQDLTSYVNFPLYDVYIVEHSTRSSHSNAYYYGFCNKKRIVLYDTILQDYTFLDPFTQLEDSSSFEDKRGCTNDEVVAIVAHELGHWKYSHSMKSGFVTVINVILLLSLFTSLVQYQPMYQAFGFHEEMPIFIGFVLVGFVASPYCAILEFLTNMLSRKFEFDADRYTKKLGKAEDLKSGLIKLYKDNLCFPFTDWMYSIWNSSHPSLMERLQALDE